MVVRYFDESLKKIVGVLFEIRTTKERSTGSNIFQLLDAALKAHKIPWKNCICFSCDNASVMTGIREGVAAYVKRQNPDVFVLGCICHRLHLAAEKGAANLPFTPVDVLVKIFYYLEKSSKRHKELKETQAMCGTANHKILKLVCTRWLSLQNALNRLLEQWPALLVYFQKESGLDKQVPGNIASHKRKNENDLDKTKKQKSASSASKSSTFARAIGAYTIPKKKPTMSTSTSKSAAKSLSTSAATSMPTAKSTSTSTSKPVSTSKPKQTTTVTSKPKISSKVTSKPKPKSATKPKIASKTSSTASSKPKTINAATKAAEIYEQLSDYHKLYCFFLKHVIPLFNTLNLELQREEPMVHMIHGKLQGFLKEVMLRFVKPVVIKSSASLKECNYKDKANQRSDEDLILGREVVDFIKCHMFSASQLEEFYSSVRSYFVSVCDYVLNTFPMDDDCLKHAMVADKAKRLEMNFSSVSYFVERFKLMA